MVVRTGDALKPCSLCGEVYYCSKACQKKSWKKLGHKNDCAGLAAQKARATAAKAAANRGAEPAEGKESVLVGEGVQSVTCLLDQKLTTLPALLNSEECVSLTIPGLSLWTRLIRRRAQASEHGPDAGGFLLLGLHTCGDLTPSMLRVFGNRDAWTTVGEEGAALESAPASWGQPAGIVNVGCCYHLLTELEDDGGAVVTRGQAEVAGALSTEAGFPLSRSVAGLGLQLGLSARMLACQAVERWPTKGEALDAFQKNVDGKWVEKEGMGQRSGEAELM